MEIIRDAPQRSEKWFKLRELRMTGSHGTAIAANGKGLVSYIDKKMQDYFQLTEVERYQSKAMIRGNELEPLALMSYSFEKNVETELIDFVIYNEYSGVSPDAFVDDVGMAEIKCPESKEYFRLLRLYKKTGILDIDTGYMWQIQMQLMVCKKLWCDYVVYSPDYEHSLMVRRVEPDFEAFSKLGRGLIAGEEMIKNIMIEMEAN